MLACGSSNCGQLGLDCTDDSNYSKFQLHKDTCFQKVSLIDSGREHTLALAEVNQNYELFTFGGNDLGELGRKGDMITTKPGLVSSDNFISGRAWQLFIAIN